MELWFNRYDRYFRACILFDDKDTMSYQSSDLEHIYAWFTAIENIMTIPSEITKEFYDRYLIFKNMKGDK